MKSICLILVLTLTASVEVHAGIKRAAVEEGTEFVMRKIGREATEEAGEATARMLPSRLKHLAAMYGDDVVLDASAKVGRPMLRVLEEVGEEAQPAALRLMARRGNEAVRILSRPRSLALFTKYGDEAAEALIRHGGMAEPLIENYGPPMTRALAAVNGRNGRRMAMLAEDGVLAKIPERERVLNTIGQYGDGAADWVWNNKGAIAAVAVVAAFVSNPEPFINGMVGVADIGAEQLVRPVAEAAAKSLNWSLIVGAPLAVLAFLLTLRGLVRRHDIRLWRTGRFRGTDHAPRPMQTRRQEDHMEARYSVFATSRAVLARLLLYVRGKGDPLISDPPGALNRTARRPGGRRGTRATSRPCAGNRPCPGRPRI
jgi:hypothetical protein